MYRRIYNAASPLGDAFFSERNIDYLHHELVRRVNTKGFPIKKQSDDELRRLMVDVYGRRMYETTATLTSLNEESLAWAERIVLREITARQGYHQALTTRTLNALPMADSTAGSRSLEFAPFM